MAPANKQPEAEADAIADDWQEVTDASSVRSLNTDSETDVDIAESAPPSPTLQSRLPTRSLSDGIENNEGRVDAHGADHSTDDTIGNDALLLPLSPLLRYSKAGGLIDNDAPRQPEPKPEPKPQPRTEPKTEPKQQPKPEPKTPPKPLVKDEPNSDDDLYSAPSFIRYKAKPAPQPETDHAAAIRAGMQPSAPSMIRPKAEQLAPQPEMEPPFIRYKAEPAHQRATEQPAPDMEGSVKDELKESDKDKLEESDIIPKIAQTTIDSDVNGIIEDDAKVPPVYYCELRALITNLEDVSDQVEALAGQRVSTLRLVKAVCQELSAQAWELEPILKWYMDYWTTKGHIINVRDVPLSPTLLDWMGTIRDHLLQIESQLFKLTHPEDAPEGSKRILTAAAIPLHVNSALSRGAEALEVCQQTLQEFIPIMMADYDQMKTERMNIPDNEQAFTSPPRRQLPSSALYRVRAAMYDLKDKVRATSVFLFDFAIEPPPLGRDALIVTTELESIAEAITTILTNHASDWIDSDVQAANTQGFSYAEFVDLDPDVLTDISTHLERFLEEVDVGEAFEFRQCSRTIVKNHQIVCLTELGHLEQLKATVAVLQCMFGLDGSQP